jgi:hypothetical protein
VNVFAGLFNNAIFLVVMIIIVGGQILLVTFAGYAFGMCSQGLTIQQWLISVWTSSYLGRIRGN